MKEVSAVELRQSLGRLARTLERTGEPVLLKVGQKPVGVIVSLRDFKERFALTEAADERKQLVEEILADRKAGRIAVNAVVAELRSR